MSSPPFFALFDLDGTLLDTEPLYTEATQAVVQPYGKVFDWHIKAEIMGQDARESAAYTIRALDLPLDVPSFLAARERELNRLFPTCLGMRGAEALVRQLHGAGVPMAVATSSARRLCDLKIANHAWFELFEHIVCGDDPGIGRLKPAPDIYLHAAEKLGATPTRCVVIEDSVAGLDAGLAAGMNVVAMPPPQLDRAKYAHAHLVVDCLADLSVDHLRSLIHA